MALLSRDENKSFRLTLPRSESETQQQLAAMSEPVRLRSGLLTRPRLC